VYGVRPQPSLRIKVDESHLRDAAQEAHVAHPIFQALQHVM